MPCFLDDITFEAAALCAIVKALETRDMTRSVLADIDWVAAGITEEQFWQWWREHKMGDKRYGTRYGY